MPAEAATALELVSLQTHVVVPRAERRAIGSFAVTRVTSRTGFSIRRRMAAEPSPAAWMGGWWRHEPTLGRCRTCSLACGARDEAVEV